ncbi:MAG: V-type ATP synthase subunit F [Candidatus Merdivicinus sp.]
MSQNQSDGKMAVIGDRESVMLFRVLGVQTITAETAEDTARAIHKLAREGCSIIYITEQLARMVPEELARYQARTCPAIIPIPGSRGSDGFGRDQIQSNIYKAVGMDLQ